MPYLMIKVLTMRKLKTLLVLNNWALGENSADNILKYFFLLVPENIGDNLHEMSKPVFFEK